MQGTLSDEVYMTQPLGFSNSSYPHHVCKLRKALYGLKQAPRVWNRELCQYLLDLDFINSIFDLSLFISNSNGSIIYILVYVDDIVLTGNSNIALTKLIATISQRFSLKDSHFLIS